MGSRGTTGNVKGEVMLSTLLGNLGTFLSGTLNGVFGLLGGLL